MNATAAGGLMPGGRLDHAERQAIAAGLAAGLQYAEIARGLGRPTSTVSREIARNGGPAGYRADHAHHATRARARRQATRPNPADPRRPGAGRDGGELRAYAERFAAMMVGTGLPRMASRVLAELYTSDTRTLTAAELVRRLRVSPASISKAIGYLERVRMVHREPDPRRRFQHYVIADDVWLQAWKVSAQSNADWARLAQEGADLHGRGTPAGDRLDQMATFFYRLSEDMSGGPADGLIDDAFTLLAVLLDAGHPLTLTDLTTTLNWPPSRVEEGLTNAEKYRAYTDPVLLHQPTATTYTAIPNPTRVANLKRKEGPC